jgi:hypothetical protein
MVNYTPYFQKLMDAGRLIEAYIGQTDRFTATFSHIRQVFGPQATGPITGEGIDSDHARRDLCDKLETARHFGDVIDLS